MVPIRWSPELITVEQSRTPRRHHGPGCMCSSCSSNHLRVPCVFMEPLVPSPNISRPTFPPITTWDLMYKSNIACMMHDRSKGGYFVYFMYQNSVHCPTALSKKSVPPKQCNQLCRCHTNQNKHSTVKKKLIYENYQKG